MLLSSCAQESPASNTQKIYNPQTVETVQGTVLKVHFVPMASGRGQGVHILLETQRESVQVHLGPDWFLASQNLAIQVGDQLEVVGSRVMLNGQDTIIASQVSKGEQTVTLRSQNGTPLWSGPQGKRRMNSEK
jgi:hypothetical protein